MKQNKSLIKLIESTVVEFFNESKQYNKLVSLKHDDINEIRKNNNKLNTILNNSIFKNKNIYIKGGVARLALQIYLNDYTDDFIRDIDYCYIGNHDEYSNIDFNEEVDYEGESINHYFKSRDITLNEVLLRPNIFIFTRRAYRDFNNEKINPKTNHIDSRLYSRVLLFSARYDYVVSNEIHSQYIIEFDFLVCLLKAYELNIEEKYFLICKKHYVTDHNTLSDWLIDLLTSVYDFDLFGRDKYIAKDIVGNNDKNILNNLYKKYPNLKKEVKKIDFDNIDADYSLYLKKPNRINNKKYN